MNADDDDRLKNHPKLQQAGTVVERTISYLMEQEVEPMIVASALLAGAIGVMMQTMGTQGTAEVLTSALTSVRAGEMDADLTN